MERHTSTVLWYITVLVCLPVHVYSRHVQPATRRSVGPVANAKRGYVQGSPSSVVPWVGKEPRQGHEHVQPTTSSSDWICPFIKTGPASGTRLCYVHSTTRPTYGDPWMKKDQSGNLDKDDSEMKLKDFAETSIAFKYNN